MTDGRAMLAAMEENPIVVEDYPRTAAPLRVAVVSETYPPEVNGVAMTIGRMAEGLQRRGHRIQLIRPRQHPDDRPGHDERFEEVLSRGVPLPRYGDLKLGLPAKRSLLRLWSLHRPDIVHVVTEGPLGLSAIAAARKLRLPVTSDFHTNFHAYTRHYGVGWLQRPIAAYLRRFHNRTDATFVPTRGLARELAARGYRNLEVVARGVDTALFSPTRRSTALRAAWGVGDGDLTVVSVGRLAPEKNLDLVLRSFAAIAARHPRARLVFVGDGPARPALEARHPEHVFAGMRSGEDLAAHYASGDLFLFPSLTETFGNVTLEAMASGLPVVAFDYAAAAETIRHGENGYLAPVADADAFVAAALAAAGGGSDVGRRARDSVAPLDWENIHDTFASALGSACRAHERRIEAAHALVVALD